MRSRLGGVLLGAALLALLGCGVQIYDVGLPSRGTRFSLPPGAAMSPDPVVQSWAAYSLAKSTCQLSIGGPRPAANSSFSCEYRSRDVLVERWSTRHEVQGDDPSISGPRTTDAYLDLMVTVTEAGFLDEYVWYYLGERGWIEPDWLDLEAFEPWRKRTLRWHRPKTRIIGYWTNAPNPR